MNKFRIIYVTLVISLILNSYLLLKMYGFEIGKLLSSLSQPGTIYIEKCPEIIDKSRICSIKLLEKRSDFSMLRLHYHYRKSEEYSNQLVVKANKGSHDNIVGTKRSFDLIEGDNTVDIPFGMYRGGIFNKDAPYKSKYIMIKARGIAKDGKSYTSPNIFEIFVNHELLWYTEGEDTSWQ